MTKPEWPDGESQARDAAAKVEGELAVLARFIEAARRPERFPLERAHYLLLRMLAAGAQTMSGLSERLALDDSTVARQVTAMEEIALVERVANPADGRGVLVHATDLGRAQMQEMRRMRTDRVRTLMTGWGDSESAAFARLLARFNRALAASLRRS